MTKGSTFFDRLALSTSEGSFPKPYVPDGHPLADSELRQAFLRCFQIDEATLDQALASGSKLPVKATMREAAPPEWAEYFQAHPDAAPVYLFVASCVDDVTVRLERLSHHALAPSLVEVAAQLWWKDLLDRLADMCRQCVALEYQITRESGQSGNLTDYLYEFQDPSQVEAFFNEYPVLLDVVSRFLEQASDSFIELCTRLIDDWPEICSQLGFEQQETIAGLDFGLGDLHNGGRSTCCIVTGSNHRFVYKPRDMGVEKKFYQLLTQLNQSVDQFDFATLTVIDRTEYGWVEFANFGACDPLHPVENYYFQTGALFALLHLFGAYDLHYENVVATPKSPVFVDLETLFRIEQEKTYKGFDDPFSAELRYPAVREIHASLLATLLLPHRAAGEDLSAVSGGRAIGNGKQRLDLSAVSQPLIMTEEASPAPILNMPHLDDHLVEPADYSNAICEGFENMYLFLQNKGADAGVFESIQAMRRDTIRCVVRDTNTYTQLLKSSFHPSLLRSFRMRELHFLNLWGAAFHTPSTIPLFELEFAALWQGDVPYFKCKADEKRVFDGYGRSTSYQTKTEAIDVMRKTYKGFSSQALYKHKWFIRGALADARRQKFSTQPPKLQGRPSMPAALLLEASKSVLAELDLLSSSDNEYCDWVTLALDQAEQLCLVPTELSLYDGIAGILLFYAYFAHVTRDAQTGAAVDRIFRTFEDQIADNTDEWDRGGAFDGWAGIAYTYLHLSVLWDDPRLMQKAIATALRADGCLQSQGDPSFDILGGYAGALCVNLELFRISRSQEVRQLCAGQAATIVSNFSKDGSCAFWKNSTQAKPLCGMSHGIAGIAMALSRAGELLGDPSLGQIAKTAIVFENKSYALNLDNWRDWRMLNMGDKTSREAMCFHHWCNGSPGIALARSDGLAHNSAPFDATLTIDVKRAVKGTLEHGFGINYSLCHGEIGNLWCLLDGAAHVGEEYVCHQINARAEHVAEQILSGKLHDGLAADPYNPGLFCGISGIGLGMLGLAYPDRVPNVLKLEGPKVGLNDD